MNSDKFVSAEIQRLKTSGIHKMDAAWQAGMACLGWPYIYGSRGDYCTPEKRRTVYNAHESYETLITKCQVLNRKKNTCDGCQWFPERERVRSFDCRGFTYWILLKIYGFSLQGAGCTSQWNNENNWKAKGTIDTVPDDVLVCLFYEDKHDPKVMAHTGFGYHGETLECSNGVQHAKKRTGKWTHWAMPACVEGAAPDPQPEPTPTDKKPTIRQGDRGTYVKMMQEKLMALGCQVGSTGADGIFGKNTKSAVVAFQAENGLTADGICGPKTWAALDAAQQGKKPAEERYTVTIPGLKKDEAEKICKERSGAAMKKE